MVVADVPENDESMITSEEVLRIRKVYRNCVPNFRRKIQHHCVRLSSLSALEHSVVAGNDDESIMTSRNSFRYYIKNVCFRVIHL